MVAFTIPVFFLQHLPIVGQILEFLLAAQLKKALELIRNHADMGHHKEAVVRADGFLNMMKHKQPDIRYPLNEAMAERVNR